LFACYASTKLVKSNDIAGKYAAVYEDPNSSGLTDYEFVCFTVGALGNTNSEKVFLWVDDPESSTAYWNGIDTLTHTYNDHGENQDILVFSSDYLNFTGTNDNQEGTWDVTGVRVDDFFQAATVKGYVIRCNDIQPSEYEWDEYEGVVLMDFWPGGFIILMCCIAVVCCGATLFGADDGELYWDPSECWYYIPSIPEYIYGYTCEPCYYLICDSCYYAICNACSRLCCECIFGSGAEGDPSDPNAPNDPVAAPQGPVVRGVYIQNGQVSNAVEAQVISVQLKAGDFGAVELKAGGFGAAQLQDVGFPGTWERKGSQVSLSNANRTATITSGAWQGAVSGIQWSSGSHSFKVRVDKHGPQRFFMVGVSPPDVDVDGRGYNNHAGVQWYAEDGGARGGGKARSTHHLTSGHGKKRIVVGSIIEVGVAFGSDETADVTIRVDGTLRGTIARGLPGPLSPAVFLHGWDGGNALTFM